MDEGKAWWMSKTLWANVVSGIGAACAAFGWVEITPDAADQITGGIVGFVNAVNILLRLVTTKPLAS